MTTLYANPYNTAAVGFYFESAEEFDEKAEGLTDRYGCPVEEFEIDFIDGDDPELFQACGIHQGNLEMWFDDIEILDDWQKPALYYLTSDCGYDVSGAINKLDDVSIYQGPLADAAEELFDECHAHDIPENLRFYIDYEKFAHDCELGGDMAEFEFNRETYTCTNAACI